LQSQPLYGQSVMLKIFLSALAILDDLGAVVIIALFYTSGLSVSMLLASLAVIALLVILNRCGVKNLLPYLIAGACCGFSCCNRASTQPSPG